MHDATQHVPAFISILEPLISQYGYLAVGLLILIEDFGVPAPGETVLIATAFFAGFGHLNIWLVVLIAILGAVIGDNIGFAIGHFGGRPLAERFGKYIFLTEKRLDTAEEFFSRNGGKVVVVARFIEGLRQLNGIIAGISGMRWRSFLLFNTIGATLWVAVWASVGYFGGSYISQIYRYGTLLGAAAAILVILYISYRVIKRYRAKTKAVIK